MQWFLAIVVNGKMESWQSLELFPSATNDIPKELSTKNIWLLQPLNPKVEGFVIEMYDY